MNRFASCIVVLACMVTPAFAQGGGREWLEKMSGPELEGWEFRIPLLCVWTDGSVAWQYQMSKTLGLIKEENREFCFDIAYASFNNADRDEVSQLVNAQRWEGSVAYRFDRLKNDARWGWLSALEPAVSLGSMTFVTDQGKETRLQISPRIVLKPFKLFSTTREKFWSGLVVLSLRRQLMTGDVTSSDIGAFSYEPFSGRGLTGFSIAFNLADLIR